MDYAGYQVINLKPIAQSASFDKLKRCLSRPKPTEILLFYRQLALLLESGLSIVTSLELLQAQASSRALRGVLLEVITDVRGGNQLSVAMRKHPEFFSPIHCQSLSVGEETGGLEMVLRQMADYMEKEIIATRSIKNALIYPVIASVVTIAVIGILVTWVLPAFGSLYSSLGAELPAITRLVINLASALQSQGVYILLALLIAAGLAFAYNKTLGGKYRCHQLALSLPLVGRVNHLNELARICRNLSLLFRAGLSLTAIMPLVIQGCRNMVIAKALIDVQQDMIKGEGLSQPMAKNSLFLPMMVQMVRVGEETGSLDTTLLAVAESYEAEAEDKTHSLIGLIQPMMTLIIAMVIGLIALSLISAMYSIFGQVA